MKEKLKNIIQNIKLSQKQIIIIIGAIVLIVISGGVFAFYSLSKNDSAVLANNSYSSDDIAVITVGQGESLIAGNTASNNSWSGEIISLNNLLVQPAREGTISEWYVHIGERVNAGQAIGRLSRPPQMPDSIMALSEKSQMMSESKTDVEALRVFTTKRISELKQLRIDTENSNKNKLALLSPDLSGSNNSLSLVSSKRKMAQTILKGSISKIIHIISDQIHIPAPGSDFNIKLKSMFGVIDSSLRNKFFGILSNASADLQDANIVPEETGLLYFDTAIKLTNATVVDGENFTEEILESLRQMLIEDQSMFLETLGEIKSMELEKTNIQRESIDTLAEIDEKIADLEKELAMAEGEYIAKKTAYETMEASINGGYLVQAPTKGVVSSIMKKPGEFVGPGMPIATVTADDSKGVLVRIKIPNNIQKPKIGDALSVIRPGFETNIQKAKLVGIGSSLDEDGSYMADAVFTEETKWPIGSSVRILQPSSSLSLLVKYSAIIFDNDGKPYVWAVSEADRIFKKQITIGRTIGDSIEVYAGLKNNNRYINNPTIDIKEDMFLEDIIKTIVPDESGEDEGDEEMHM